jgi:hypothetical protein
MKHLKPNEKMKWPTKQKAIHFPLGPHKTLNMHNVNQKPCWKWCWKKIGHAICLTCFLKLIYIPLSKLHEKVNANCFKTLWLDVGWSLKNYSQIIYVQNLDELYVLCIIQSLWLQAIHFVSNVAIILCL